MTSTESLEPLEPLRHVAPPVSQPKVISAVPELRRGQQQNALALHEGRAEVVDAAAEILRKTHAAGARPNPAEPVRIAVEKSIEQRKVRVDDVSRPCDD